MRLILAAVFLCFIADGAQAQTVVTSTGPDKVSVTVYRAPDRGKDDPIDLGWLRGYALITETRTISVPAGDAVIRFEGVAAGIQPESAIVTGLPDGVSEKNQDADLLTPRGLLAASLMRPVTIRRTDRTTGKVVEEEAVLRSGPDGGIVMQTRAGFEAVNCSGLNEALLYDKVPVGLSAKPTLSVRTSGATGGMATLTLSYLAFNFDWQANYVAQLSKDDRNLDLYAWVTLANGDETSFINADTQTVAGRLNRGQRGDEPYAPDYIKLSCWPNGRTSDPVFWGNATPPPPPAVPPPLMVPAPVAMYDNEQETIVVTAARSNRQAVQEELGDLKLYRIPQPVTVAARSQKQVTMIDARAVPVTLYYGAEGAEGDSDTLKTQIKARLRNRKSDKLGLPLPAGGVAVFKTIAERPVLLGETSLDDKAIDEDVELSLAPATSVTAISRVENISPSRRLQTVMVRNASPGAVLFEFAMQPDPTRKRSDSSARLINEKGRLIWRTAVKANGRATLRFISTDVSEAER